MRHFLHCLLALFALAWASTASAAVTMHFHSFNGSVLFGRYPHTFVVLEGTLDATGEQVNENFGWSAKSVTPAVLSRPVEHMILVEEPKMIRKTNRHFSVTLSDEQYRRIKAMVIDWRDQPVLKGAFRTEYFWEGDRGTGAGRGGGLHSVAGRAV